MTRYLKHLWKTFRWDLRRIQREWLPIIQKDLESLRSFNLKRFLFVPAEVIRVHVTEDDIQGGVADDKKRNPIVTATLRSDKRFWTVEVHDSRWQKVEGTTQTYFIPERMEFRFDCRYYSLQLPYSLRRWYRSWYWKHQAKPTSFLLRISKQRAEFGLFFGLL